jgi:hypothetical protein
MRILHPIIVAVSVFASMLISQATASSEPEVRTVFAGKIIRALSVDPVDRTRILVGLKGQAPGSAKVFESRDRGRSWRSLNEGLSLSPQASDVQAVASISRKVVFAGTWKHGLFVSRDGGKRFERHPRFLSNDVRGFIAATEGTGSVIYAATARDGVFRSRDEGMNWDSLGPGSDFFWSLSRGSGSLYAISLEKSIYRLERNSTTWEKIFDRDDSYSLAVGPAGRRLAVAAQTGAYLSHDAGATWQRIALAKHEKLSSALFLENGDTVFGSWSGGLIRYGHGTGAIHRFFPKTPVLHLAISGEFILLGTWGDGLKILPIDSVMR